ncbi:MAG: hypothetical protein EXR68_06365 [Dehalococcoidia bacterium]|nr:hypothetical protein [Dehalococcoidia bacterium]
MSTAHLGISERQDLFIPRAGSPQQLAGDYLYYNGRSFKLREGSWGIIRVYDGPQVAALRPLPGHQPVAGTSAALCPAEAPLREFNVSAIEAPLPMLAGTGRVYALNSDRAAVRSVAQPSSPLVLRANVGDCIKVTLSTRARNSPASMWTCWRSTRASRRGSRPDATRSRQWRRAASASTRFSPAPRWARPRR